MRFRMERLRTYDPLRSPPCLPGRFSTYSRVRFASIILLALGLFAASATPEVAPKGRVVVLLEPGCPIARFGLTALRECFETFGPQGVRFQGHVPNRLATEASVATYREKFSIPFPVSPDSLQLKATELGAAIVPEVFVYDAKDTLIYRGRIDDAFVAIGKRRPKAHTHDLKRTLTALLNGDPILISQTTPVGCAITSSKLDLNKLDPK